MKLNQNQLTTVLALLQWADKQKKTFLKELEGTPIVQVLLNPPPDPKKKPKKGKAAKPKSPIDQSAFKAGAKALQRAFDAAKTDERIGRGMKIKEWYKAGEFDGTEADTKEVLEAAAGMLDSANAADITAAPLFLGNDGVLYTVVVEASIEPADDEWAQEILQDLNDEAQAEEIEDALTDGAYTPDESNLTAEYELCKHCDHFIDSNEGATKEQAQFVHLADERYHVPDDAHAAEPRGEVKTLARWQIDRPDLFAMFADGSVGPNSAAYATKLNQPGGPTIEPAWERPVAAKIAADDESIYAEFNAANWFVQAGDEDILKLAACGWSNDYPADNVALHFDPEHEGVTKVVAYAQAGHDAGKESGFEVEVNRGDAVSWVQRYRPALYPQVIEAEEKAAKEAVTATFAGATAAEAATTVVLEDEALAAVNAFTDKAVSERAATVAGVALKRVVPPDELKAAWDEFGRLSPEEMLKERDAAEHRLATETGLLDRDVLERKADRLRIVLAVTEWIDTTTDEDTQ